MPKLKRNEIEQILYEIGKAIEHEADFKEISIESLANTAGVGVATMYNRKSDPGTYRLEEIIRLFIRLGIKFEVKRKNEILR